MLSISFQTLEECSITFASCYEFVPKVSESGNIDKHVIRFTKVLPATSSKRPNIVVAELDFMSDHFLALDVFQQLLSI